MCLLIPLGQKSRDTALYFDPDPDGTPRITRVRIRGEAADHVIPLQPQE